MKNRYKCSPDKHNRCSNNALCHLCDGEALFHDPKEERRKKEELRKQREEEEKNALLRVHKKEKKEGMAFEKKVADLWNQRFSPKKKKPVKKPRIDVESIIQENIESASVSSAPTPSRPVYHRPEARRQINSGAFWHSKGDIKLEHALIECKERGTVNSRGEKQITIQKEWLEKQAKEAIKEQRPYWYLPFGFKGDDEVYLVKPYDHEIELIYELRQARQRIEELEQEIARLQSSYKEVKEE